MRIPRYLSYSAMSKYYSNLDDFYKQYLCEFRNPRPPQRDYMAVGSGFDAFVKSQIYTDIFGNSYIKGSGFEFDEIFEKQVEAHIRDSVFDLTKDIWEQYVESGAYAALLSDIALSPYAPQMEWRVEGEIDGVPMLGLPDLRYITKKGVHVICDFKVNGACSKKGASPFQGYKICRDCYDSRTHNKSHAKYKPMQLDDVEINETYLEVFCDYWADQLSTYAWLLGEPIGSEQFVIRMEQLCLRPVKSRTLPRGKFATHMARVSELHQLKLLGLYQHAWRTIKSGHIFTNLSREASDEKMALMDAQARTPKGLFPQLHRDGQDSVPRFFRSKG